MHLAILVGALYKGGTERVIINLVDYLLSRGHQITVVTQYKKDDEYPLIEAARRIISDISITETTNSRIINFYRRFMKLRRIWQNEKPDVILSFIGKNNIMAILTSRFLRASVVVAVRGAPSAEYPSRLLRHIARFCFRFADGVLFQTEESQSFFPLPVIRKGMIIRNPVSPSFFRPIYEGEREKTIVAVGRIDENKNHRMLIQAFSEIAMKFPEYQVIIYGEGAMRKILKDEVLALGLADRIFLPGNSAHIDQDIYQAGIYVLCSDTEGSPNALIEAMLLGLACIATDCPCGGPAELIDHGVSGLLTPVGDVKKLTENLQYLMENPHLAEQMGRAARCLQTTFDPQTIYETWERYLCGKVT
jgi:glycosyltransferase involved in cell wall biosynthesis